MERQAITGSLYIIDGEPQAPAPIPGIVLQPAPKKAARGRDDEFLFVHLTLDSPPPNEPDMLLEELTGIIAAHYFTCTGSTISALRRTVLHINDLLLRWNIANSGGSRDGAVTCAVLRGAELLVTQVGPACAFIGHNFGIERLPPDLPEQIVPLGRKASLDFQLSHHNLEVGTMLLLCDPIMYKTATAVLQPALVDTEVEIGLEELTDVVGNGSARLALIEFSDEAPLAFPDTALQPTRRLSPSHVLENVRAMPLPKRPQVDVGHTARQATASAVMGLSKATGGAAEIVRQLRPSPLPPEATPPSEPPPDDSDRVHWAIPASVAIIIPLIIAIVFTGVYFQYGQVNRFSQLRQELSQALGLAAQASSEEESRDYYNRAVVLAAEAEQLRPGDEDIANQRSRAIQALDRLDNVTRLTAVPLYTYPETSALTAVAIRDEYDQNGDLFVLDGGGQQLLRHPTDPITLRPTSDTPDAIVFTGQAIQSHVVGTLVDILWRPKGSSVTRDGVAVLDGRGQLITFYTNFENISTTPFDLSSQWRNPTKLIGFSERVYVLDDEVGAIWRYFPEGDALTMQEESQEIEFSSEANLTLAVDADISSQDGSIVVLYEGGQLRRYVNGRTIWTEVDLASGGLSSPIVRPTAVHIIGQGLNSSIFVLDAGSGRLLQFSLGGTLLTQFRATDEMGLELFSRASNFAVAENPLRVFITAENVLYAATLE